MTKEDIQLLYEYDRWANGMVFEAASRLSPEQFTKNLGGAFPSVRDTLLHIVAGEWVWFQYWNADSLDAKFVADLQRRRDSLFDRNLFQTFAEVRAKWVEVEKEQIDLVASTSDEALHRMMPYRTMYVPLVQLMQHVANHSTYHRGQVSLMMRQLGAEPAATDFHVFLAERRTDT